MRFWSRMEAYCSHRRELARARIHRTNTRRLVEANFRDWLQR